MRTVESTALCWDVKPAVAQIVASPNRIKICDLMFGVVSDNFERMQKHILPVG